MPLLSGAAGIAATGCGNYDLPGFVSGGFYGVRANTVGQAFSRRFSAIDYKLQRQALHREDMRDLIELTTARMDIYHIVGTLLLAFCIGWYTDNSILASRLPTWFSDLFFISNFAAVGYLILCVWLAMYAAVAARSIGVRLLTSYSRLSLPSKKELDDIKNPIFFNTMDVLRRQREKCRRSSDQNSYDQNSENAALQDSNSGEGDEDDQQHFRRFLEELPRWIHYDTWSRVCMSFGMNQMLQALSYFILGVIWEKSPMAAVMSFVAVKILGYIVLWLDVGDMTENLRDRLALSVLNFLPPFLAAGLLFYADFSPPDSRAGLDRLKEKISVLSTLCFWAHACWLIYLQNVLFRESGQLKGRFRPGGFAEVLDWVNFKEVRRNWIHDIELACRALEKQMYEVVQCENKERVVSIAARSSNKLLSFNERITRSLGQLAGKASHPEGQSVVERAHRTQARFKVWSRASEVFAGISSLMNKTVQERMTPGQRALTNDTYEAFLSKCSRHALGIRTDESMIEGGPAAMTVNSADFLVVRIDGEDACWIDTSRDKVLKEAPSGGWLSGGRPVTALHEVIHKEFDEWSADAKALQPIKRVEITSGCDEKSNGVAYWKPAINGGPRPGVWSNTATTTGLVRQHDWTPTNVFRWFTIATIVWWVAAGFAHAFVILFVQPATSLQRFTGTEDIHAGESEYAQSFLQVEWPAPARLFKVAALQCKDDQVWISSRFSLYETAVAMSAATGGTRSLKHVRHGRVAAILCHDRGCDSLSPPPAAFVGSEAPWILEPLSPLGKKVAAHVPIPSTWRLVTGAWSSECPRGAGATTTCDSGLLMGWDGTKIAAATLQRDYVTNSWEVNTQYEIDPSVGLCPQGQKRGCKYAEPWTYENVTSLQLGADGRSLVVLLDDGILDAWDLSEGIVRGRFQLDERFTSICHTSKGFVLARQDRGGPRVVTVPLPPKVAELLYPKRKVLLKRRKSADDVGERRRSQAGRRGVTLRVRPRGRPPHSGALAPSAPADEP